jgi:hypothetical protein
MRFLVVVRCRTVGARDHECLGAFFLPALPCKTSPFRSGHGVKVIRPVGTVGAVERKTSATAVGVDITSDALFLVFVVRNVVRFLYRRYGIEMVDNLVIVEAVQRHGPRLLVLEAVACDSFVFIPFAGDEIVPVLLIDCVEVIDFVIIVSPV